MRLRESAVAMQGQFFGEDAEFSSVSTDSRNLRPGELFFAIKGENFNGEVFVERAFEAGACAAVVTKRQEDLSAPQIVVDNVVEALGLLAKHRRKDFTGKVIGVTGSCGKTAVKGMLANILGLAGATSATRGNLNNQIGVPLTILTADMNADFWVVEAGTSYKGEIKYLTSIVSPDFGIVINVHPAHIEGFGSLDAIADEKSDLLISNSHNFHAIFNAGLSRYAEFGVKSEKAHRVTTFSTHYECKDAADICAKNIRMNDKGCASFDLVYAEGEITVSLSIVGEHYVENALAAASCALTLDVSTEQIQQGLNAYTGDKGRMQYTPLRSGELYDDSYNANPASMRAAIDYLAKKPNSILVLGDMAELGSNADKEHTKIGEYAKKRGIDTLYCLGYFAQDYADGFGSNAEVFITREILSQRVVEDMTDDTTVLIKGSRSSAMDVVSDYIAGALK